jgi:UDP-N-acetylmuramyl pentapeptide synthase
MTNRKCSIDETKMKIIAGNYRGKYAILNAMNNRFAKTNLQILTAQQC